jgi:integrase
LEAEERAYLLACPQPLQNVATLILDTGMRPTEVYTLRRQNVFLEKGLLKVEDGKTESSNRNIYLSDRAAKVIAARLSRFGGDYLFPKGDEDGAPPAYQLNDQH